MSDLFPTPCPPAGQTPAPPAGPPVSTSAPAPGPASPLPIGRCPSNEEEPGAEASGAPAAGPPGGTPRLQRPARGCRPFQKPAASAPALTPEQRLLLLDAWRRSGLPAGDFAPLVGI